MAAHQLLPEWIKSPKKYEKEIKIHLERRVGYAAGEACNLTENEWKLAKYTGTNLTSLTVKRTDCLIRHAANLTELQIKLY